MIGYLIAGGLIYYLYKKGELSNVAKAASDALKNLPAVLPSAPSGEVGAGATVESGDASSGSIFAGGRAGLEMSFSLASKAGCACDGSGCRCGGSGVSPVAPMPITPQPVFGIGSGAPVASPAPIVSSNLTGSRTQRVLETY